MSSVHFLFLTGITGLKEFKKKPCEVSQFPETEPRLSLIFLFSREFGSARDILFINFFSGASEPYVVFEYKDIEYKTEYKDTLEPQWNHSFYLYAGG
jgi:hypothetical protein